MSIRVECYAGFRAEQEPLAFWLGVRRLVVRAIVDRWFAPGERWFKVHADDGHVPLRNILRHNESSDGWELSVFTCGAD